MKNIGFNELEIDARLSFYDANCLVGKASAVMHQSFVSTAPLGPGISGAFNFSLFKAPLKALHSGAKIVSNIGVLIA